MAFNAFTATNGIGRLRETAAMIRDIARRAKIKYWLIPQPEFSQCARPTSPFPPA